MAQLLAESLAPFARAPSETHHESIVERRQAIYRQLRDCVVAIILDGMLNEADALPSVRNVATECRVKPLMVLKAYQQLVDERLVEKRRGRSRGGL